MASNKRTISDDFTLDFRQIFQALRTPDVGSDMIVNRNFFVEHILPAGVLRRLAAEEMNHYRTPYREPAHQKPLWRWPNEIPIEGRPADVTQAVAAYSDWLQQSDLPKLLFHATPGAILPVPLVDWCKQNLENLKALEVGRGIHYLQEDHPHRIDTELAAWYRGLGS